MGEEYGETAPFPYFVSHSDPELIESVRRGRRAEFASFEWQGEIPDPQDEAAFLSAKLRHELRNSGEHEILLAFYRELISLRKSLPALAHAGKEGTEVKGYSNEKILAVERWCAEDRALMLANLGDVENSVEIFLGRGRWHRVLDSAAPRWHGRGSVLADNLGGGKNCRVALGAYTLALFRREDAA